MKYLSLMLDNCPGIAVSSPGTSNVVPWSVVSQTVSTGASLYDIRVNSTFGKVNRIEDIASARERTADSQRLDEFTRKPEDSVPAHGGSGTADVQKLMDWKQKKASTLAPAESLRNADLRPRGTYPINELIAQKIDKEGFNGLMITFLPKEENGDLVLFDHDRSKGNRMVIEGEEHQHRANYSDQGSFMAKATHVGVWKRNEEISSKIFQKAGSILEKERIEMPFIGFLDFKRSFLEVG